MMPWNGERRWWPLVAFKKVSTKHNGTLRYVKVFNRLNVVGGGVYQSGKYMEDVFAGMLRLIPKDLPVKRILLIGLGAGSCLKPIFRKFPNAHIVALEYDQTMVELCRVWSLPRVPRERVEIIFGDFIETLPLLSGEFDLILIDAFVGAEVAPSVVSAQVCSELRRLLSWRGAIGVNWFRQASSLSPEFEKKFTLHRLRKVKANNVGLYRRPGMGKRGEPVPEGYKDREESHVTRGESVACTKIGRLVIDRVWSRNEPITNDSRSASVDFWNRYEAPSLLLGSKFPV